MNNVLFVRKDGLFAVSHINDSGKLIATEDGTSAAPNWTHVVPVGNNVLFVRNDGLFAISHINSSGKLIATEDGTSAAPNWTHVIAAA
jgi:hypothetical protein